MLQRAWSARAPVAAAVAGGMRRAAPALAVALLAALAAAPRAARAPRDLLRVEGPSPTDGDVTGIYNLIVVITLAKITSKLK